MTSANTLQTHQVLPDRDCVRAFRVMTGWRLEPGRSNTPLGSVPGASAGRYRPHGDPYRRQCAQAAFYAAYSFLHPRRAHGPLSCTLMSLRPTAVILGKGLESSARSCDQLMEPQVGRRDLSEYAADAHGAASRHQLARSFSLCGWNSLSYASSGPRFALRHLPKHVSRRRLAVGLRRRRAQQPTWIGSEWSTDDAV